LFFTCDRSETGGDGRRRGGGGGGAVASTPEVTAAVPWRPPPTLPSTVAIVLSWDGATVSVTGGGRATKDLEIEGALSDDAVFTVSLGNM